MCSAIEYQGKRVVFSEQNQHPVELPVLRRDGGVEWVQWGIPYGAAIRGVPSGACVQRESLLLGKLKRLKPSPVKIPCSAFMVKDGALVERWFDVADHLAIQGALILLENTVYRSVYGKKNAYMFVVTESAAGEVARVHDRQPRLVIA